MDSPGLLTCVSCRVLFARGDLQREHYKTEWHRYNLKRKVAELPPVTLEAFESKVLAQHQASEEAEKERHYCACCNKFFQSVETFENHCGSKKHKEASQKQSAEGRKEKQPDLEAEGKAVESESESESDWGEGEGLGLEECLFCSETSESMEASLKHMSLLHGFFIPDLEFCTDLPGLLTYLGEKVGLGFVCLWCNERGKTFHSLDAVQKHMRDKGHCKLCHDANALLECGDYFDYSCSYPDKDDSEAPDDIPDQLVQEKHWQLVLPSGATVGHRSLHRYFKQRLKPETALVPKKQRPAQNLISHYRSLGWVGITGEVAVRKAKDLKFMHQMKAKRAVRLGLRGNRVLQPHFRSQNPK